MKEIIQVYAFTDVATALKAVGLGVDHIGFVAGKYGEVPAELTFEEAREITAALPPRATAVALTMATDVDEIMNMVNAVKPAIVHISSDLNCVGVDAMRDLRSRLDKSIRLMKAIPVENEESVQIAKQYAAVSDLLLLDTKRPDFPGVGATGFTHDWNVSKQIVDSVGIPVILAGGLSADNVQASIRKVHPWGVDSNTSTNVPGSNTDKDIERIAAFVRAIRADENDEVAA